MKLGLKGVGGILVVGLMALPVLSQAAIRSTQVDESRVVITYQKEDLKSLSGRASLEREIRNAAELVCGDIDYWKDRSLQIIAKSRSCYSDAVAGAMEDIESGMLQVTIR